MEIGHFSMHIIFNFKITPSTCYSCFLRGAHGKNGADIRMAIDIIEDLAQNPHISIIVVLGGDSDYISIAQKVRQKGRRIVGIGVQESTNQYWIRSCNEFKFYASLLVKSSASQVTDTEDVETNFR